MNNFFLILTLTLIPLTDAVALPKLFQINDNNSIFSRNRPSYTLASKGSPFLTAEGTEDGDIPHYVLISSNGAVIAEAELDMKSYDPRAPSFTLINAETGSLMGTINHVFDNLMPTLAIISPHGDKIAEGVWFFFGNNCLFKDCQDGRPIAKLWPQLWPGSNWNVEIYDAEGQERVSEEALLLALILQADITNWMFYSPAKYEFEKRQ